MNKLKVVAVILALIILVMTAGQFYLKKSTGEMVNAVNSAQTSYQQTGNSPATEKKVRRFLTLWSRNSPLLSMFIYHREIDIVNESTARLPAYLKNNEDTDFDAECDMLKMQLAHLWNVEKINWENIL